jgi:imidazolonepropionase-like amidohydrolase
MSTSRRPAALLIFAWMTFAARGDVTALIGVNVVPMDVERVLYGQTVLVVNDRIETIGDADDVQIPDGARIIDGRERWLVPGLTDMHVHVRASDLPRYVANGITTVRDLAGLDSVLALASRRPFGPRIHVASRLLAGVNGQSPPFSVPIERAEEAQALVDAELARGCDSIKLYEELSRETFDALVHAARLRGVKVAGHVTRFVDVRHAMTMQDSIEHLSGYPLGDPDVDRDLAAASRDAGVWNCPTMTVYAQYVTRNMPPAERQQYLQQRRALLTALHDANARILAGTDSGYLVDAGTALHDELDELVAAGFTPFEALSAATRSAGEFFGEPDMGVIAPGARADLVLVRDNPLEHLSTLRKPSAVMLEGHWISYERRRAARH